MENKTQYEESLEDLQDLEMLLENWIRNLRKGIEIINLTAVHIRTIKEKIEKLNKLESLEILQKRKRDL